MSGTLFFVHFLSGRQDDFIIEDCVPLSVNEPNDHCATARSRRQYGIEQTASLSHVLIEVFQCSTCKFVCILPSCIRRYFRVVPPKQKPVTITAFMLSNMNVLIVTGFCFGGTTLKQPGMEGAKMQTNSQVEH